MKRLIYIMTAIAAAALLAASCTKEGEETVPQVPQIIDSQYVGEWHLIEATSEGVKVHDDIDVYLVLNDDCTFELYQKSGSQHVRYDKFTGTCWMKDGKIIGEYSDGTTWGASYIPSISSDILTLSTSDMMEVQKYKRESLSQTEKENANLKTKADGTTLSPIL